MRFAANVSILFGEVPLLDRFGRAAAAGFDAVELWWPRGEDLKAVERAVDEAGLDVALLNFDAGDMPAGDRGLLSDPARDHLFRANVDVALALAGRMGCRRLNALVGLALPGRAREEQLALARDNVRFAADRAAEHGADILIEPVNTLENGRYLLSTSDQALRFIDEVERPNVLLQYDLYHMQRMEGDLSRRLREHIGRIGHIQVADPPGRGQPGTGELNFDHLLRLIDELGYEGYVGLEYRPVGVDSEASLEWLPRAARGARRAQAAVAGGVR